MGLVVVVVGVGSSRRYACSQSEQEAGKWSHFLFCQVAILQQRAAQGNKSLEHVQLETAACPSHSVASSRSKR